MFSVIIKELRVYANNNRIRNIQILYVSVLSLLLFLFAVELSFSRASIGAKNAPGSEMFSVLIISAFLLLLALATPVLANFAILEEDDTLSPLKRTQIIMGKLSALSIISIVMLLSILPLLSLSAYTGGLPLSKIGLCYLIIFIASVAFNLIGMFWAVICVKFLSECRFTDKKREESTIIASYATICTLTFMPFILPVFGSVFGINIQVPTKIAQAFSPLYAICATLGYTTNVTVAKLSIWWFTSILYVLVSMVLMLLLLQEPLIFRQR